jgi:uncharacterized membrane protein
VYDWLLFLHVLSAALLVGALAYFWALVVATRPGRTLFGGSVSLRMARPASIAVGIGVAGTLIFGLWLAIYLDDYHPWDGWIIASLVLWAIGGGAGGRSGQVLTPAGDEYPTPEARRRGVLFHTVSSVAAVLVLVLMIWKPGA